MALQVRLCGALLLCSIVFCTVESIRKRSSSWEADEDGHHSSIEDQAPISLEVLAESFHAFDRNDDGYIDREEVTLIIRSTGEPVSEEEIDELMKDGDKNADGMVDFAEFLKMVHSKF